MREPRRFAARSVRTASVRSAVGPNRVGSQRGRPEPTGLRCAATRYDEASLRPFCRRDDAVLMRCDAVKMRCDAVIMRCDAVIMRCDAVTMRCDAVIMRCDKAL